MMPLLRYCLLACVLLFSFPPLESLAYQVSKTDGGSAIKWSTPSATYVVNIAGGPSGCLAAIQAAAETWSEVPSSSFRFVYGGIASNGYKSDGVNSVSFGTLSPGTLGQNTYWYNPNTGVLLESDIVFNTYYRWDGSYGSFDVQNIATHEFGHSLCLNDLYGSSNAEKTMYYQSAAGETKKRTLHQDDIDGISYLYAAMSVPKPGGLSVTIVPQGAIDAGAKWRVDAGSWQDSGATVSNLKTGLHKIEFNDIPEWTKPANSTVRLANGEAKTLTETYIEGPKLSIEANVPQAFTSDRRATGQFTITRTGGNIAKRLMVTYAISGTATNGKDYRKLSGKVAIRARLSTATITVKPRNNKEKEGPKTVTVSLPNGQSATVTIEDND